jgi:putative acetyltransferase
MHIRGATAEDCAALVDVWLASVRQTHRFLTEAEVQALLPAVRAYLAAPAGLWVLSADDQAIGFMGVTKSAVDSLFISPQWLGQGGGKLLLAHARALADGPLTVDVNEQNPDAIAFYEAAGFEVVGRSDTDDAGRPYPLLHMRQTR